MSGAGAPRSPPGVAAGAIASTTRAPDTSHARAHLREGRGVSD
jgi:hypothetical protein